jgi:hypothetical protein
VQAASYVEWPDDDSWWPPINTRRVAAISFSIHCGTAGGAGLTCSAENVKLVIGISLERVATDIRRGENRGGLDPGQRFTSIEAILLPV